jgi:hypothetical protein
LAIVVYSHRGSVYEIRRRRNSAMRILKKRGLTRFQAMMFGVKRRARRNGVFLAIIQSLGIFVQDAFRTLLFWTLRLTLIYPLTAVRRLVNFATGRKRPKKIEP